MRSPVLALMMLMAAAAVAVAQPSPPSPEEQDRLNAMGPPPVPPAAPLCELAQPPPPPAPGKPAKPPYQSPYRQSCESELANDTAWWFDLEGRLRAHTHIQNAKEIATNNRHVVLAYGAMWLLAIGFVVVMWRRQQALKHEIERLSRELKKAETS